MTDLILHKHEKYITEDLNYYFSGKRDINNQIRPNQDIYSLTLNSLHILMHRDHLIPSIAITQYHRCRSLFGQNGIE